jgi:predicted esterase
VAPDRLLQPQDRSRLERAGYEVSYREFDGGHVVPPDVAREAASWFAGRG